MLTLVSWIPVRDFSLAASPPVPAAAPQPRPQFFAPNLLHPRQHGPVEAVHNRPSILPHSASGGGPPKRCVAPPKRNRDKGPEPSASASFSSSSGSACLCRCAKPANPVHDFRSTGLLSDDRAAVRIEWPVCVTAAPAKILLISPAASPPGSAIVYIRREKKVSHPRPASMLSQ